jgi:hypothetical protein
MSKNKKLSKAIRERMARTGESYSTARMHVLAKIAGNGGDGAETTPTGPKLTNWLPDPNPRMPQGTLTRVRQEPTGNPASDKPLLVVPRGFDWAVILAPTLEGMIQGRFAATTSEIACLYADDFLHSKGFTGPGIGPLPESYPPLRGREDALVPSEYERSVLEQGARCECGYVGAIIRDRYQACPSCNGIAVMTADTLAEYLRKRPAS